VYKNPVIPDVLSSNDRIDLLKVDIEGLEVDLIRAIAPASLDRIDVICFEWNSPGVVLHPDRYDSSYFNETYRLTRTR
jgi:hypothetical protein